MESNKTQEALLDGRAGAVGSSIQPRDQTREPEPQPGMKNGLMKRFLHWLYPNQRKSNRHLEPPLVAYLGTGRTSQEFPVNDISVHGFYILTTERWPPDTVMPITLQRVGTRGTDPADSIVVQSKVIRFGPDGVAFVFVMPELPTPESSETEQEGWGDQQTLERFLQSLKAPQHG